MIFIIIYFVFDLRPRRFAKTAERDAKTVVFKEQHPFWFSSSQVVLFAHETATRRKLAYGSVSIIKIQVWPIFPYCLWPFKV